jgi:DNA invertase Pin-like site-specific DNA recombinase
MPERRRTWRNRPDCEHRRCNRARPQLALALASIRAGDILVVTTIDRLARSLSHLLEIVERLTSAGVYFRSLSDPIDTNDPSGGRHSGRALLSLRNDPQPHTT